MIVENLNLDVLFKRLLFILLTLFQNINKMSLVDIF